MHQLLNKMGRKDEELTLSSLGPIIEVKEVPLIPAVQPDQMMELFLLFQSCSRFVFLYWRLPFFFF